MDGIDISLGKIPTERAYTLSTRFSGENDNFEIELDRDITIRVLRFESNPGKYISMSFEDFDRIISEYERFKNLLADANRDEAA
jgi:hypothetical protein